MLSLVLRFFSILSLWLLYLLKWASFLFQQRKESWRGLQFKCREKNLILGRSFPGLLSVKIFSSEILTATVAVRYPKSDTFSQSMHLFPRFVDVQFYVSLVLCVKIYFSVCLSLSLSLTAWSTEKSLFHARCFKECDWKWYPSDWSNGRETIAFLPDSYTSYFGSPLQRGCFFSAQIKKSWTLFFPRDISSSRSKWLSFLTHFLFIACSVGMMSGCWTGEQIDTQIVTKSTQQKTVNTGISLWMTWFSMIYRLSLISSLTRPRKVSRFMWHKEKGWERRLSLWRK